MKHETRSSLARECNTYQLLTKLIFLRHTPILYYLLLLALYKQNCLYRAIGLVLDFMYRLVCGR
jgi:hypothetical protein